MKIVDFVKRRKQSKERMPKRRCAFETFEKWFCNEFNLSLVEGQQRL